MDTCVKMYTQQATGVAAEYARFSPQSCTMSNGANHNLQRPETVESLMCAGSPPPTSPTSPTAN